ncbi:MAG: hypothetical protein PWQ96_1854 [Clostridia bacterium]|nr:hypothetical protein [Clostridia bacterium]
MAEPLKILLVDDEESIRKVVEQTLKKENYQVLYAPDGEKALEIFKNENLDLIILDVMIPERDGFEVCQLIRQESSVPIIILSAKSDIVDKSVGFNLGADDYLTKPFSPVELSLRVKALIRRTLNDENKKGRNLQCTRKGDLEIDCKSHEIRVRGKKVELTPKEFELLCFLADHPGQVFTREQIFKHLWGEEYIGDTGTITVLVRRIREKIEKNPAKPEFLKTVWGVGYKFSN